MAAKQENGNDTVMNTTGISKTKHACVTKVQKYITGATNCPVDLFLSFSF